MASVETTDPTDEYTALTERCGLVDRSGRGKLALTGADAVEFLNGQVTNELLDLTPGHGRYAAFLTHKGKMLGDLRILVVGDAEDNGTESAAPNEILLDTERVGLQGLFDMIRRFKVGYRVELHKRTLERTLLSLVGPRADRVAGAAFGLSGSLPGEAEHEHVPVEIAGTPVLLIRTDVGLDALFDATATEPVCAALQRAGAEPVGESAAEIVRVESGRPRYGVDVDETTIPQEGGLNERAVSFSKGCYVGQETVARLHYKGKPNRHLRGLHLSEPAQPGARLRLGEREVGRLGSVALSPRHGRIGLALVRREAEPGDAVAVGEHEASATVVELPFG